MEIRSPEQLWAYQTGKKESKPSDVALWFFIVVVLISVFVKNFAFSNVIVDGSSMDPYLKDGDFLTGNKVAARRGDYTYGDILVIKKTDEESGITSTIIKRVVAFEGDVVQFKDGAFYLNGEPVDESAYLPEGRMTEGNDLGNAPYTVKQGEIFVLGDNRSVSVDSRKSKYMHISRDEVMLVISDFSLKNRNLGKAFYNFRLRLESGCKGD